MQMRIADEVGIRHFDRHVIGDVQRLARIPYTVNIKSGRLAYIIEQRDGSVRYLMRLIDEVMHKDHACGLPSLKPSSFYKPCIVHYAKVANPDHIIRWAFVKLLQAEGYAPEHILTIIRMLGWRDYDPSTSAYQVYYTTARSYSLPSCARLKAMGYCLPNCHFRRWRNAGRRSGSEAPDSNR